VRKSLSKSRGLIFMVVAFALAGCRLEQEPERLPKHAEAENTVRLCSDGIDNDGNGLIDCDDPGCLELGTPENPGPGMIVCPHIRKADGSIQFLESVVSFCSQSSANCVHPICMLIKPCCPTCPDGTDIYTCSDGKDNDGNGFVDCQDNACKGSPACCIRTGPETSLEACSDGIDNDCDGYTDCASHTCTRANRGASPEAIEYCRRFTCGDSCGPEDTLEACSDGIDNDGNGFTDCADYSCSRLNTFCNSSNPALDRPGCNREAVEYCVNLVKPAVPENTEELCSDGIDNDLNGLIDCDDPACKGFDYCNPPGGLTQEPPDRPLNFSTLPASERAAILALEKLLCTDGIDNDRNGRKDCEEYRCQLLSLIKLEGDEAMYQIDCGL